MQSECRNYSWLCWWLIFGSHGFRGLWSERSSRICCEAQDWGVINIQTLLFWFLNLCPVCRSSLHLTQDISVWNAIFGHNIWLQVDSWDVYYAFPMFSPDHLSYLTYHLTYYNNINMWLKAVSLTLESQSSPYMITLKTYYILATINQRWSVFFFF